MTDLQRKTELESNHSLFDQTYGCCGFAATVMSLLDCNQSAFNELYSTVVTGAKYRDITIANRVKSSIQKRLATTDWKDLLDIKMCVGLMIIFKEYLGKKKIPIWNGLKRYSALFDQNGTSWTYGTKIRNTTGKLPFSYKRGDLALTIPGCKKLMQLVHSERIEIDHIDLATNIEFKPGIVKGLHPKIIPNLKILTNGFKKLSPYAGAIIGMANNDWHNQATKYELYDFICHWVYVPQQSRIMNPKKVKVWTWGDEFELDDLITRVPAFTPKTVLAFRLA